MPTQLLPLAPPEHTILSAAQSSASTTDQLFTDESFDKGSKAVKAGGQMSLINVQKDVDTLVRTRGSGITLDDLTKDLQATGLNSVEAGQQANLLNKAATSGDDQYDLQNELAHLFNEQGGLAAESAQGLANKFVSLAGQSGSNFQTSDQVKDVIAAASSPSPS